MNSSEARSLLFGVVGIAAVGVWYLNQSATPDAQTNTVVAASPVATPLEIAVEPVPDPIEEPIEEPVGPPDDAPIPTPIETVKAQAPVEPQAPADPMAVYSGAHKLGVNRITDMARVGKVKFSKRDGALHLEGRVQRGPNWLSISGSVEPDGPQQFTLNGTIKGVPDMAWKGEAPTERSTTGRFTFRVTKNRPYWRLYEVNGADCVCWDNCGNDFCYIDIERQPNP